MKRHTLIVTCIGLLSAAGCGDGSSAATSPAAALPTSTGEQQAEAREPTLVIEAPGGEVAVEDADALAAPAPTLREVEGLELRRLVVARDVEAREPVEAGMSFRAEERPMYAFLELRNRTEIDRRVSVTFEDERGRAVGHVELDVPATAPRWRTWMRSRMVTDPGRWTARVHDEEGRELGELTFELLEG
jgi:hypothetical protein